MVFAPNRLVFRAVHQDTARFGVRADLVFVVGRGEQILPAHQTTFYFFGFFFKWVKRHKNTSVCKVYPKAEADKRRNKKCRFHLVRSEVKSFNRKKSTIKAKGRANEQEKFKNSR